MSPTPDSQSLTRFLIWAGAFLLSEIDQLPDIVIEIKFIRRGTVEVWRRVREGKYQLLEHLAGSIVALDDLEQLQLPI